MAAAGRFHRWGGHLYADRFRPEGCRRHHVAADGVSGGCSGCRLSGAAGDDFPFQAPSGADPVMCRRVGAPHRCRGDDFYLCNRYFADSEFYSHTLKISLVFPLVCLVFDLLALRAIFRDEKLVRSLDRIR